MKTPSFLIFFVSVYFAGWASSVRAEAQPLILKMTGVVEIGGSSDHLTNNYPSRHSTFIRGQLTPASDEHWTAEINQISEFGDRGTLFVGGYQKEIGDTWVAQVGASTSDGGATLPRLRLDFGLGRKWLEQHNLVTTLSVTSIRAKDEHRDRAIQFASAYYFDLAGKPLAVEGGIRYNTSDPGSVGATSYFTALTMGREKERVASLRFETGRESYQAIGGTSVLVDFPSNSLLFTWREWVTKKEGFQLRLNAYHNPFYDRRGIEASFFSEF